MSRRDFVIRGCQAGLLCAGLPWLHAAGADTGRYSPIPRGPAVDRFKRAQSRLLSLYGVSVKSRSVILETPSLPAHVLDSGDGPPVLLFHGGGLSASSWVQLLAPLQAGFHTYAPDMPGCGLTYRIDYRGMPYRKSAEGFVGELMDALELKSAALIGHSLGGYSALAFALSYPERVTKLVLLGEPAGSQPRSGWVKIVTDKSFIAGPRTTMRETRDIWSHQVCAHIDRVKQEMLDADNAQSNIAGYDRSWNSTFEEVVAEKDFEFSYGLRRELHGLRPPTLFVWGDKDFFGPPSEGQAMANLAPHAKCEILEDTGHAVFIDQPERTAHLVQEFLSSKS
jgi:pimeloyl-ACP methyl ester carboxylesterase